MIATALRARPPKRNVCLLSSTTSTCLLLLLFLSGAPWEKTETKGRSIRLVADAFVPRVLHCNARNREQHSSSRGRRRPPLHQEQQQQGIIALRAKTKTSTTSSSSRSSSSSNSSSSGGINSSKVHSNPPSPQPSSSSSSSSSSFSSFSSSSFSSSSPAHELEPHYHASSVIATKLRKPNNAPTVWVEFGALAASLPPEKVINLGQGFPNWNPPAFVTEAAHAAINGNFNQYTRTAGHPALVQLLAERYSKHMHRTVDPMKEVAVTVGASQALYIALQSLVAPGDEVILLEPFFDLYVGQIRLAGGTPVFVPLVPNGSNGWDVDMEALAAAITPKTRLLILNSPHNPTGKVFTRQEMEGIAALVRSQEGLVVISDEVYKFTVFEEGSQGHIHFASLPGMFDRTLTVSSAGKTFSVTGWQVGWIVGPATYLADIQVALPYIQFCASTPMQEALTHVIRRAELPYEGCPTYYSWLAKGFRTKRDRLTAALEEAGIKTLKSEGGFFLLGDVSHVAVPEVYLREGTPAMPVMTRDWAFCRWLALEYGVVSIPTSAFYGPRTAGEGGDEEEDGGGGGGGRKSLVRFTFCKTDETLEAAAAAFRKLGQDQRLRREGGGGKDVQ